MKTRAGGSFLYLFVILMALLMRISGNVGMYYLADVDSDILFTCVVQLLCFGLLPLLGWWILIGECRKDQIGVLFSEFNFKKCSLRNWLRALAIAIPLMIITLAVSYAWNSALSFMGFHRSSSTASEQTVAALISEIVLTAVLPGVFEEITHRGLVFSAYRNTGWRVVPVSALLFALMHQNITQTGYTFVFGLVLALIVYYSGSIYPAMFLHFFNNFISVISGFDELVPAFGIINTVENWLFGTLFGIVVCIFAVLVSAVLLVVLLSRTRGDAVRQGRVPPETFGDNPYRLPEYLTHAGYSVQGYVSDAGAAGADVDGGTQSGFVDENGVLVGASVAASPAEVAALREAKKRVRSVRLSTDLPFWVTVCVGVATTAFSLAWGFM